MEITRPTIMEVDTKAYIYNKEQIQAYVGKDVEIMPVIKANAYGTQLNTKLEILNFFSIVGVAIVDEGVKLRELGYQKEIFILNQPYEEEIEKIVDYDLTVGVSSIHFIHRLGETGKRVKVHIEIGTGMGRMGIHPNRVEEFIKELQKYPNILIEGMYTHLSSADKDEEYTNQQLKSFAMAVEKGKERVDTLKYFHASASNGIANFKDSYYYNLVRPGIILYGYQGDEKTYEKITLKPVAKLKSKITFLKTVKENTSIGYGRSFITQRETKVATIPIGYADGLPRSLSNKGYVWIRGKKAPIIGSVCMDGFMADVTDIPEVNEGDDVYIWDNENITLEEVAELAGTINHEILSRVSYRVPRVFM